MMCMHGVITLLRRNSYILLIACKWSLADFDVRGSAKIALDSWFQTTIMCLFPLLEVTGNFPVWSLHTLPDGSIILE